MNLRLFTMAMAALVISHIECRAFEYKEVFLPEGANSPTAKQFNLNNVDRDWGIWGHNVRRIIGSHVPFEANAMVDGKRNAAQLCFSSQFVYNKIYAYINENYGGAISSKTRAKTQRFVIMPYDNALACTCPVCKARGNTPGNATPAVSALIAKLCKAFPAHIFLTSYYSSTAHMPTKPLPANAGVIISAIDWPLRNAESPKEDKFKKVITQWKAVTDRIYVWDYINNFDDYVTPFPCLAAFSDRIRYYHHEGVKGLFLNGSGPDYSTFSDMKTYVLASLMDNPNADWKQLCSEFFTKNYPVAGTTLSDYAISIEQNYLDRKRALDFYTGVKTSLREYLDADAFIRFYDTLKSQAQQASGNEKTQLNRLVSALSLTRMELARISGKPQVFTGSITDMKVSESDWQLTKYLEDYKACVSTWNSRKSNGAAVLKLTAQSPLDEDYTDLRPLTDGIDALPSNYHCGWVLFTLGTLELKAQVTEPAPAKAGVSPRLRIQMLQSDRYHFSLPKTVEVYSGGSLVASVNPTGQVATISLGAKATARELTIKVIPDGKKKMALGEISIEN